jgi:hypothetical protein
MHPSSSLSLTASMVHGDSDADAAAVVLAGMEPAGW